MTVLRVFILETPEEEAETLLRQRLDAEVQVVFGPEMPDPADYHVLVVGRPEREHLAASPNLRTLIIPWAGLAEVTRQRLGEFPHLAVHNLHHNAQPTAELALALLFSAAKFIVPFDRDLRANDWTRRYQPNPSMCLEGKTGLVLGYGQIGQRVGVVLGALGMRVLGVRLNPGKLLPPGVPGEVHSVERLHGLLPQANVLMVTLPLTEETQGLLGEGELGLLPRGAVLVNVARGAIIDQGALYHALREGRLAAAGLDVWYNYPENPAARVSTPPADFPFNELDNVVLSPHRGGSVAEIEAMRMEHLARSLNAAARGEPVPSPVDVDAGY
jgi:phosphoglycerate dehydrogenase-like enzyme